MPVIGPYLKIGMEKIGVVAAAAGGSSSNGGRGQELPV